MCSAALGCRLPASMALAAELLPCTWRARGVILLTSVGAPLGGVFALIFRRLVDVFSDGNPDHAWRLVLGFCCLLDGIVFYFFRNHMAESPFFLRQQGRVRECSALLTEVAEINELVLPDDDMPISSQVTLDACALRPLVPCVLPSVPHTLPLDTSHPRRAPRAPRMQTSISPRLAWSCDSLIRAHAQATILHNQSSSDGEPGTSCRRNRRTSQLRRSWQRLKPVRDTCLRYYGSHPLWE